MCGRFAISAKSAMAAELRTLPVPRSQLALGCSAPRCARAPFGRVLPPAAGTLGAMRARLKGLSCDEIPDLARWRPPEPEAFVLSLILEVGALGLRGRERFELLVVTPAWLESHHGRKGFVLGTGMLLVFEWDYQRLRAFLAREVERCTGRTWPEVARKVGRIATWEGEGGEVVGLE